MEASVEYRPRDPMSNRTSPRHSAERRCTSGALAETRAAARESRESILTGCSTGAFMDRCGKRLAGRREELSCTIEPAATAREAYVATRRPSKRTSFPADTRSDECSGPSPARARPSYDRSSRAGVRANDAGDPRRIEKGVRLRRSGGDLSRLGYRRVGGGAGEHAFSGRQGAHVRDRSLRDLVAQDGRQARAGGRLRARRLAKRRRRSGG